MLTTSWLFAFAGMLWIDAGVASAVAVLRREVESVAEARSDETPEVP